MTNNALGPPLPLPALMLGILLTGALVFLAARRVNSVPGIYVLGAIWFRYVIAGVQAAATTMVGPFSLIALTSLALFGAGLLVIKRRLLALRFLLPVYLMCAVVIISAVLNASFAGAVNVLVKYGFFIVVTLCTYQALRTTPDGRFMRLLLFAFAPLIIFQLMGLALGVTKSGENDGSVSHIGGYAHEATFSVMLITMLTCAALNTRANLYVKFGMVLAALAGIFLANYRTTILAALPMLGVLFGLAPANQFPARERPFVTAFLIFLACIAFGIGQFVLMDRFQDITVATGDGLNLIKPPEQYTPEESRILSGRPIIWSTYITDWLRNGSDLQFFIGLGPEAWVGKYNGYAHNTLVCTLYEYGIIGAFAIVGLWLSMLAAAFRVRGKQRPIILAAHISFLVLNMGTEPMWMVEGMILYGVLCGYTLFMLQQKSAYREPQVQPAADAQPVLDPR